MKLQSLAIIFVIIIMPISIVLSEYVNNKIITAQTELTYNTRLLNSTHDAIKAYQINTVNNAFGDITTKKIEDIEAAANTFFYSLNSSFNYTGYKADVMKEYVPAIAFTLYDGYYIYSPFENTLTGVRDEDGDGKRDFDTDYSTDGESLDGLKPYVSYSCRYIKGANDFIITYTLDNYITIQGKVGTGEYYNRSGYLYLVDCDKGIKKIGDNTYSYNDVIFTNTDTEQLKEYIGKNEYPYAKINGQKYYFSNNEIFYIDIDGEKIVVAKPGYEYYEKYKNAIEKNKSAFQYYKEAYEFSKEVFSKFSELSSSDAEYFKHPLNHTTSIKGNIKIFDNSSSAKNIEGASSNFNEHRKDIIRYVIETNLMTAISSFASNAKDAGSFVMPKISETDWEIIENDVCAISFMQGLTLGSKRYNGYSVVANTLTKEYVDEDDIYILADDNTVGKRLYWKANDKNLLNTFNPNTAIISKASLGYYPGVWKLNFEQKQDIMSEPGSKIYYIPLTNPITRQGYLGSYTSIYGNSGLDNSVVQSDMYTYIKSCGGYLKEVYFKALGRERWGSYHISNSDDYFLKDY